MFWNIRWTDALSGEDKSIVIESESKTSAECMALRRGIPFVVIHEASDDDVALARQNKLLWKYTPSAKYMCFGQPVGTAHVACLMLCGIWTMLVLLIRVGKLSLI
jgi:hypothetical protein